MLYRLLLALCALLISSGPAFAQTGPSGQLRVTAPIQATVFIDCEEAGPTPMTRYLPTGTYTVRVVADGFTPYVRRVSVANNQVAAVSATLLDGGNTLEFCVEPVGGQLTLNGEDGGYVPSRLDVAPGNYEYKVVKEGYEPLTGQISVENGGNPLISGEMVKATGRFSVTSNPEGAEVYLDGELMGKTPLDFDGVAPGVHKVALMSPGKGLVVREVDTTDGRVGEVSVRLKDDATRITIKAKGETILLDGIELGPDKASLDAARGKYSLQAGDFTEDISVKSGPAQTWVLSDGELVELPPLTRRPVFWAATGGGAAAAVAVTTVAIIASRPEPQPDGDIVVQMP